MQLSQVLIPCALLAAPQDAPSPPDLLDHQGLSARMHALAEAHPELCETLLLGRSRGGRAIEALRLAHGELAPGRPAILVVGNVDGPQVFSSGLVLWQAERLLERHASEPALQALLSSTTLYLVPRANPDGAEARFATPLLEREGTGQGIDDDRDGREGEDPPADVDGDGVVAWMRVPHPEGTWLPDPSDPRASLEADATKGERGSFRLLREGRDADGDEEAGEDAPQDARVNRNFASGWHAHEGPSGRFAMDEPETRALADFVIAQRDVALVVTYGALDNLRAAPKSVKEDAPRVKRVPQPGWLEPDAALLAELGRRREDLGAPGQGDDEGSFQRWAYDHRGLISLAITPWDIPLELPQAEGEQAAGTEPPPAPGERRGEGDAEPSDEAKRLAWCDAVGEAARWLPWTRFEHPELGPVEVGGWRPYARSEPPADAARELAAAELDFLTALGDVLPRLALVDVRARELGGGLVEVEAALENAALLPLRTASARRTETVRAARVELVLPEGAQLVAGRRQELVGELAGAGGRHELRWLVAGERIGSLGIRVDSDHAGSLQRTVEVTR